MIPLVVVGAGGFGRETLDVVSAINRESPTFELLGVVDDHPSPFDSARLDAAAVEHLGPIDRWLAEHPTVGRYAVAIGSPAVRDSVSRRIASAGGRFATLVHPRAVIGSAGEVADGVIVCSGVQVSTNVRLGAHVHLNPGSIIGHDTRLRESVSVNPGAVVSGSVSIGPRTLVGAGATILQGLSIGSDAIVGAAACVTSDVEAGVVVAGVPARPLRRADGEHPADSESTS